MSFQPVSLHQVKAQLARIEAYELADMPGGAAPSAVRSRSLRAAEDTTPEKTPDASVIGSGVMAFVFGMREQNKADVRNSYLFATLVASKKFPGNSDGPAWFGAFLTVMKDLGWAVLEDRCDRHEAEGTTLSMDRIGLDLIGSVVASVAVPAAVGPALLKVATAAIDGLKKPENDKPLCLFNAQAEKDKKGHFTLSACTEDADGDVSMAFGAVHNRSDENPGSLLFTSWTSSTSDVYKAGAHMALNPLVYNLARDGVLKRLGQNVETAIANYEI